MQFTLQPARPNVNFFKGFCPVTPHGFGLGYQIRDEELGSFVSVFKQHNQASDMTEALEMAFSKIAAAVES